MAPINPPVYQQASSYSARLDRLMVAGLMAPEHGTGALAARGGVRPTPSNTGLQVTQRASPGMWVTVGAGIGYVPAQSAVGGVYEVFNDASYDVAIGTAHATLARRDLVVARVYDAEYAGASNIWGLEVVQGTAAGSPVLPSTPAGAIALAQVQVSAGVTTITNASITDLRTYTTALGGTIPVLSTARPGAPYKGMAIYETNNNRPMWYNGTSWTGWADEGYLTTSALASYLSANGYVTSSDLTSGGYLTQANLDALTWSSYTPTWGASSSNPSLGNGSITGRYFKLGKWCHVHIGLNIGSTSGMGGGIYSFTLPFTPANFLTGGYFYSSGVALFNDSSTGAQLGGFTQIIDIGSGQYRIRMMTDSSADVGATVPFTWANGDDLDINMVYQVA